MLDLTYRVVQNGQFVGYVVSSSYKRAEYHAQKKFGANCIVMKLVA